MFGAMDFPSQGDVASRDALLAEQNTDAARAMPDGNWINVQFIRPDAQDPLPCIYYIHGGGMQSLSCYDGNYKAWGRMLAAQGVAVAMVDFRNSLQPSSAPEVAPYPAGLNDCISGLILDHSLVDRRHEGRTHEQPALRRQVADHG